MLWRSVFRNEAIAAEAKTMRNISRDNRTVVSQCQRHVDEERSHTRTRRDDEAKSTSNVGAIICSKTFGRTDLGGTFARHVFEQNAFGSLDDVSLWRIATSELRTRMPVNKEPRFDQDLYERDLEDGAIDHNVRNTSRR